jgi:hypothetical protein
MADSSAATRATLAATSKVASEFGEAAIEVLQVLANVGGNQCNSWFGDR